jgi:predicted ester cyclase
LRDYLIAEYATFPDACETIDFLVAEGDRVAVHSHCHGTQTGQMGPFPASGRTLSADFISIYRIADGRIAEAWAEWDSLAGLIQLGHVAPPSPPCWC